MPLTPPPSDPGTDTVPSPPSPPRRSELTDGLAPVMALVVAGDQSAFATLYDTLGPLVHGLSLRVLRDPDLAAESTQDVMLEVWRTADRFDASRGTVKAWVATMAHRRAVDRVRSIQSQRTRDELDATRAYLPPVDEVAEEVLLRADAERVATCIDTLTATQRESVDLAYWEGLTYREVAERLGAALPTVKSRIRDGLIRLRDCLGTR